MPDLFADVSQRSCYTYVAGGYTEWAAKALVDARAIWKATPGSAMALDNGPPQ
jgi:hypothetical protein